MALKVYVDHISQPSRAIIIFCKINNISFEEIRIDLVKGQQHSPEYRAINPMGQVPAIIDGDFILTESHAILVYIACQYSGVSNHWYPSDQINRAKINSILHWHHSNLRRGAENFVMLAILGPTFGIRLNPAAASKAEKLLTSSLKIIENFWLKGNAKFLLGNPLPSIADLSLVCEIMELKMIYDKDWQRVFGPRKKILQWIENVRNYTNPYFDEVHKVVYEYKERLQKKESSEIGMSSKL